MGVISESLVRNTRLKHLRIRHHYGRISESDCFESENLLCDFSSIDNIYNSNHMLEEMNLSGHTLSPSAKQCLELNKNKDKDQVVHNKIKQFYFTDEFDLSPFSNMPVCPAGSLSQIGGEKKKSAIYRLLQCMPQLCNSSGHKCTHQSGNNRQKIYRQEKS
jgi:hypothetical protein